METPRLLMTAGGKREFSYHQGYDEISTEELQLLLRLARQTVFSLETELAGRSFASTLTPNVQNCVDKMQTTLHKLNVLQRVDDSSGLMSTAAKIMQSGQVKRRERIYKQFLIDVCDQCGAGTALLCAKGLGKRRIIDLNNRERVSFLGYLKANDTIFQHPIIESYASELGITQRMNAVVVDTPSTSPRADVARRKYKTHFQPQFANNVDAEIEYKYSEASIDAISMLGSELAHAVQASAQYKWERRTGGSTKTDCIQGLTPKNGGDITLQLLLGLDEGTEVMERLEMRVV
ncbi:hypothetical protein NLG97_g1309 [Lecanicillium saksenae]|uniref:Uncharacterized protein n=1 Tax=Lecanicillium saksenae TaxID=468837 RepID=A0ACC1R7F7_9HYPO|nr:hypothetical protein NLG97_g1309 [Lecanicillium saksenae]